LAPAETINTRRVSPGVLVLGALILAVSTFHVKTSSIAQFLRKSEGEKEKEHKISAYRSDVAITDALIMNPTSQTMATATFVVNASACLPVETD
jgi:hypothetical protein